MMEQNAVMRNSLKAWVLAARPKTLAGAAVPLMIGTALALNDADWVIRPVPAVLCFLFAFIMQIDANFINDYFDYMKGTDDAARLGPRRACAQGWIAPETMKRGIAFTTFAACVAGFPLVLYGGVEMVLVGMLCVLFCFLYTTWLSYRGMGDVLVLVFFGVVPVTVTYYLEMPGLHTAITAEVIVASIACGIVIDTLLIVNNYRDIETDRRTGKRTIVVRMGASMARTAYLGMGWLAALMGGVFLFYGHWAAFVLPVGYLWLHTRTYRRLVKINKGKALNLILGETARNMFIYGLLVAAGILLELHLES